MKHEVAMVMFGCSEESLASFIESCKGSRSFEDHGMAGIAVSLLSDAQELLAMDAEGNADRVRKLMNRVKYILMEAE